MCTGELRGLDSKIVCLWMIRNIWLLSSTAIIYYPANKVWIFALKHSGGPQLIIYQVCSEMHNIDLQNGLSYIQIHTSHHSLVTYFCFRKFWSVAHIFSLQCDIQNIFWRYFISNDMYLNIYGKSISDFIGLVTWYSFFLLEETVVKIKKHCTPNKKF